MNAPRHTSLVSLWHHRVLGGFWALLGLGCIADLHRGYWWEQRVPWIPALVGLVYVASAIGFVFVRTWARRVMTILMVVAALIFADLILMAGWVGNHKLMPWVLAGFGVASYTHSSNRQPRMSVFQGRPMTPARRGGLSFLRGGMGRRQTAGAEGRRQGNCPASRSPAPHAVRRGVAPTAGWPYVLDTRNDSASHARNRGASPAAVGN